MAQIFYVHCPACRGKFPCHPELWNVNYDLLCPFCQHRFPQETSPLIITMTGEQRPGTLSRPAPGTAPPSTSAPPGTAPAIDPDATAESM